MKLVSNLEDVIQNLKGIEKYLSEGSDDEISKVLDLIKKGTVFIVYNVDKEYRFAPSRYIGYCNNTLSRHSANSKKDGRLTTPIIAGILNGEPIAEQTIDEQYMQYCYSLGIYPNEKGAYGRDRRFWITNIALESPSPLEIEYLGFVEGRENEKIHKYRERNRLLVLLAKKAFLQKHGRLFCQVCSFDFKKMYGDIGDGYIEAHHIIPVHELKEGERTKIEDLAMVCSNCHKMLHVRRPWLKPEDLKKMLKKNFCHG